MNAQTRDELYPLRYTQDKDKLYLSKISKKRTTINDDSASTINDEFKHTPIKDGLRLRSASTINEEFKHTPNKYGLRLCSELISMVSLIEQELNRSTTLYKCAAKKKFCSRIWKLLKKNLLMHSTLYH